MKTKKLYLFLLLAFVIIQFIRIDKSVPEVDPKGDYLAMVNIESDLADKIQDACYDCHSYQTEYPWYAEVAPVSWWLKGHVDHGRGNLNFSIWNSYSAERQSHKLEECIERIQNHSMPLTSYTWMHSNAKMDDDERQRMVDWFSSSYAIDSLQ